MPLLFCALELEYWCEYNVFHHREHILQMDFDVDSFILPDVLCGKQGRGGSAKDLWYIGSLIPLSVTFLLAEMIMILSDVLFFDADLH